MYMSYTCNVYVQGGQNDGAKGRQGVVRGSSGGRQGVARGSSGGRQGVARGSPGGRQPCVTPKIYYRRPKSPPTELILEPLDANLAAQVLIFDDLLINFMFFDRFFFDFQ